MQQNGSLADGCSGQPPSGRTARPTAVSARGGGSVSETGWSERGVACNVPPGQASNLRILHRQHRASMSKRRPVLSCLCLSCCPPPASDSSPPPPASSQQAVEAIRV